MDSDSVDEDDDSEGDDSDAFGEDEATPIWKNPLFLGGAAIAGFFVYKQTQKAPAKKKSKGKKK